MSEELYKNLNRLESAELLHRVSNSQLTTEAHKVALQLLMERGVDVSGLSEVPEEASLDVIYGTETAEEKSLTKKTFASFFLLLALPLVIFVVALSVQTLFEKSGSLIRVMAGFLTISAIALLLRWCYLHLVKQQDKLSFGVKAWLFVQGLMAFAGVAFVTLGSIFAAK
jgi:hypothetical protein